MNVIDKRRLFDERKDCTVDIKRITKDPLNSKDFENELKPLQDLNLESKNIVRYDLVDYMKNLKKKTKDSLKTAVKEMLHCLQALHTVGKIHCALKPRNVLIASSSIARLPEKNPKKGSSTAGGQRWEATEILNETEEYHTKSSDIQVAGMLVYYILSDGKHPFGGKKYCKKNICNGIYSLDDITDKVAKDLIERMINKDPTKRPTIDEVLRHPYFKDGSRVEICPRDSYHKHGLEDYMTKLRTNNTNVQVLGLKKVVWEVLHDLKTLHSTEKIHGNVKPSIVFIECTYTAKLADYGISCKLKKGSSTAGEQIWEATEILNGTEEYHTKSSNIQVAGMLVYYILSDGKHPFGENEQNIKEGFYTLDDITASKTDNKEVAKNLIKWMINKDPTNRPTIDEVLRHPYFKDGSRVEICPRDSYHEHGLEDYMTKLRTNTTNVQVLGLKKVVWEVLHDLKTLHSTGVTHCDLKLSNIVIVLSNAKLADYGISCKPKKRRNGGQSWEATEILNGTEEYHTKSSNIQVAGMLVYYILSDGKHPFGENEQNIKKGAYSLDDITDIVAKDLIERMINKDPTKRPTIDEVLRHPYFWDNRRKEDVLRKLADRVQPLKVINNDLKKAVEKYSKEKLFSEWKSKIPWKNIGKNLPEDLLGLLCFFRILLVHEEMFLIEKTFDRFPDFFTSLHRLAIDMSWEH